MDSLYSPDIVSMEAGAPPGQSRESKGLAAVKAKGEWWVANHEVHSAKVEGPLVARSSLRNDFHVAARTVKHSSQALPVQGRSICELARMAARNL